MMFSGTVTRRSKCRPGYSLIEMLVVISVSVMLLSLMYSALVGVLRRTTEPDLVSSRFLASAQVADPLRQDLRRSASVRIDPPGNSIQLEFPGSVSATWRLAEKPFRLERVTPGAESPGVFGLTGFASGKFERFETGSGRPALVRLTLTPERPRRRSNSGPVEIRPVHFEFAIGTAKTSANQAGTKSKTAEPKP